MRLRQRSILASVAFLLFASALPAQTITEFPLPANSHPSTIIDGPDGNLWFLNFGSLSGESSIGRMTTTGTVTQFPIEEGSVAFPRDIATGPDGNIWFVQADIDGGHSSISRMTPQGVLTRFSGVADPLRIAAGPDGNLWVTLFQSTIARVSVFGESTIFQTPAPTRVPLGITAGPDGNVWFTEEDAEDHVVRISRITPSGVITEFPFPNAGSASAITVGSDGNLWFTQPNATRIGRITPSGVITEFPIAARALDLIAAPDGNIWFTHRDGPTIGRITTGGTLMSAVMIGSNDPASGLTVGPDRNVWFTQFVTGKIGRIALAHEPAIDSRILPVVGSTAGVGGSYFRTAVQLHNPTAAPMAGRIVFHRSRSSGGSSDPALTYSLSPGQTQSIADLLPTFGRFGLGSADLEVTAGSVPAVTARVFNDAGSAGTTGFTEELMRNEDALRSDASGVLLLPADLARFRFNVGLRTLEAGATATMTLRDASGAVVTTLSRAFPATYHEQQNAAVFLGVSTVPPGGSLSIAVSSGAAIFYGATVDNTTGDPSLQIARPAP